MSAQNSARGGQVGAGPLRIPHELAYTQVVPRASRKLIAAGLSWTGIWQNRKLELLHNFGSAFNFAGEHYQNRGKDLISS
jgi:hypothetical protein